MILDVALNVPVPKTFDYLPPDNFDIQSHVIGSRVKVLFGPRFLTGIIVGLTEQSETPPERLKKISSFVDTDPILDDRALALGRWLSDRYLCSFGEALDALLPPKMKKEAPVTYEEMQFHSEDHSSFREAGFSLTTEQDAASKRIHEAIYFPHPTLSLKGEGKGEGVFLLRGVSAAGKTEVYISAIRDIFAQGKSALYLAPEIGLVDQIAGILKYRFGADKVCVWHSGRSVKQRREDWWKIKRGELQIVVGARSAALLPLQNLGLIVMDEEQDSAWKEDRKPRFHVRDVALARARLESAVVIFGSATPSLEILFEAKEGRAELLEMNERAVKASAPRVQLIDMKSSKVRGILSPELQKAISDRLAKKEQTILFINRRGFHRYVRCPHCDWTAKCNKCGVTMVEHKTPSPFRERVGVREEPKQSLRVPSPPPLSLKGEGRSLICHYCSQSTSFPTACPSCGHKKLTAGGTGTERVVEEIKDKFPWAKVARWDRDSVKKKGSQEKILQDFQSGDIDVLVGTQIVAQGFHFPKVTLVGVVNADTSLHVPDFRAAEHTFQLLMQVAGRAGRDLVAGEVLIQTRHIEHPALQCAAALDYKRFSDEELKFREDLFYPPFTHLINVETAAKDVKKAEKDINDFVAWIMALEVDHGVHGPVNLGLESSKREEPIGILGPTPSTRKRQGITSFHVLLKIPRAQFDEFLIQIRQFIVDKHRFRIDVDPS